MVKKVVLEGCLGDWSKKSYIEPLAERARQGTIELYAVDVRDIREDEDKVEYYESPVLFVNRKSEEGKKEYEKIEDVDFVFIVAPHEFHCKIAEHWLEKGRLNENDKIFIEKPLDSSVENIKNLEEKYGEKELKKIIAVDHYIPKIIPLIKELKKAKGNYGKMKKVRINLLESDPILESRGKTLDEGLILDIFPHVLAVFIKIMKVFDHYELDANGFEIFEVKTGKYKGAPITGETFAEIGAEIEGIPFESCIGKAVGSHDTKILEISFERGLITADFASRDFSIQRDGGSMKGSLQKNHINMLLDRIIDKEYKDEVLRLSLNFNEGFEIVRIISKIREKAGNSIEYEKFNASNEILTRFGEAEEDGCRFKGELNEI